MRGSSCARPTPSSTVQARSLREQPDVRGIRCRNRGEMWSAACVKSRQRRENNRFVLHPPQVVSAPAGVASKRGLPETANRQVSARADRIIRTVQTQSRCWGGGERVLAGIRLAEPRFGSPSAPGWFRSAVWPQHKG